MRGIRLFSLLLFITIPLFSCTRESGKNPPKAKNPTTDEEKLNYALGVDVGHSLKNQDIPLHLDSFVQGLEDAWKGQPIALKVKEREALKKEFANKAREAIRKKREEKEKKNRAEGSAFLAENAEKKGVITTTSGLQYKVIKEGEGPTVQKTDQVSVHYRGTLIDGTEFDNSAYGGKPAVFNIHSVIPGWTEALQLMKAGGKYQLFIPPHLAYDTKGAGALIEPGMTLVFDIELLAIIK